MTRAIYRQKTRFKTFTPGKILGQAAIDESKTQNLTWLLNQHHDAQYRFDNHSWHFFADAVNLQDYGDVDGLNFKDWLEQKVQQAQNEGQIKNTRNRNRTRFSMARIPKKTRRPH